MVAGQRPAAGGPGGLTTPMMKARAAAIARELETGGGNGKIEYNRELSRQSQ